MKAFLKIFIAFTALSSLLAASFPPLAQTLALSRAGIEHLYLWQFFTYPLIEPRPLSFGFFIQLAFNLYLLWVFGHSLIERLKPSLFCLLYFGSAALAGLSIFLFPHAHLAGSTNAIYALLVAWALANPGAQLLLFFAVPFRAHILIAALLGLTLLLDLTAHNWLGCLSLLFSLLFSYAFSLLAWREPSPIPFLNPFERKLFRFLEKRKTKSQSRSKIYDIQSGKPILDDDQFMDAMLEKISRHGEEYLTPAEKKRMKEISEKR